MTMTTPLPSDSTQLPCGPDRLEISPLHLSINAVWSSGSAHNVHLISNDDLAITLNRGQRDKTTDLIPTDIEDTGLLVISLGVDGADHDEVHFSHRNDLDTLERESAQRWATSWAMEREAARLARQERRSTIGPPDDEHVWLDTTTAAVVVGVTVPWLRRLAETQRAPATKVGHRWWWRRDLVEAYGAARAARQTR